MMRLPAEQEPKRTRNRKLANALRENLAKRKLQERLRQDVKMPRLQDASEQSSEPSVKDQDT
jgi:hypothetical protein